MKELKKLSLTLAVASVLGFGASGCAAPELSLMEKKVKKITDTTNCEFVDTVYFETRPQTITHYARINTVQKGGNAYQNVQGDNEKIMGADVIKNTIDVYKCRF